MNVTMDISSTPSSYQEKSLQVYKTCAYTRPIMKLELFLCCAGMVNTLLITLVFTRSRLKKSSMNLLIAVLEISNFITMATRIPATSIRIFCPIVEQGTMDSVFIEAANSIYKPSIIFANWLTPVIGWWRFVAVTWPLQATIILTKRLARIILIILVFPSLGFSLYIFFFRSNERSNYTSFDLIADKCYVLPDLTHGGQFLQCWKAGVTARNVYLTISVIMSVVPCVLSVAVNIALVGGLIYKALMQKKLKEGQNRRKSLKSEAKTTIVLVVFLTAHCICYVCPDLFTLIVYTYENVSLQNRSYFCFFFYHFPAITYLSFLSLVCYCLMSENFRKTIYEMLRISECVKKINLKSILREKHVIQETRL